MHYSKLILSLIGLPVAAVQAANPSTSDPVVSRSIETIVVTANRVQQDSANVAASVVVIDRSDIEQSQYQNVPDLLAWVTGIDISRDGGQGQSSSLYLRGTSTSQTLILIDGVRVGSATLGYASIGNMALDNIERIEIIKGPRAAQYGSDAIGGVIQIFTRQALDAPVLSASYGSHQYYQASVAAGKRYSQGRIAGSIQRQQTRGYNVQPNAQADNDGYRNNAVSVHGNWTLADFLSTSWNGSYSDGYYEYDHSPYFVWHDNTDFSRWHINNKWNAKHNAWTSSVNLGLSRDKERYTGNQLTAIEYVTERKQITVNNEYRLNSSTTVLFGYDGYKEDISDSSETFIDDSRINNALFAGVLYQAENWGINASARNDHQTQFSDQATYQVGAYWRIDDWLSFRVSRGTGFKAPTFNDLYSPFGGNRELNPENSKSTELGADISTSWFDLSAAYFTTDINNLIIWTPDDEQGTLWSAKNISSASIDGFELDIKAQFWGITHSVGASWLDPKNNTTGTDLAKRADTTYNYQALYTWREIDFSGKYRYQSARAAGDFFDSQISSYSLFTFTAAYSFAPDWTGKLRIENAFDKEYQTNLGYQAAGREVYATLVYQF